MPHSSLPTSAKACAAVLVLAALFAGSARCESVSGGFDRFLGLPEGDGPMVVRAQFHLRDISQIDDEAETFAFSGVLTLTWKDARQAFDPAAAGVREKVYQGAYQFNELAPAWYPQVVLSNESGLFETNAVILRVQPDGLSILSATVNAVAEADLDMRRYPFDFQRLEAVFEVFGFDTSEVRVEVGRVVADPGIRLSQWSLEGLAASVRKTAYAGETASAPVSQFVVEMRVRRQSMFVLRLVALPLGLIVALSWSVFWMDRSSLGDRINLSFVGILTAVAYQIVVGDLLPHVSYITLMHAFLNMSFFMMCASVVVNLVVGVLDKRGLTALGDRVDYRCRWIFPLVYAALLMLAAVWTWAFFPPR